MSEENMSPEKILKGISLTEQAIELHNKKGKLLDELRGVLVVKAIELGLIDGRLKREEPCPVCRKKQNIFSAMDLQCHACNYDARGARAIWERLHGRKS